jgi:hypothetical protein
MAALDGSTFQMVSKADACQAQGISIAGADGGVSWLVVAVCTAFALPLLSEPFPWAPRPAGSNAFNSQEDNGEGL